MPFSLESRNTFPSLWKIFGQYFCSTKQMSLAKLELVSIKGRKYCLTSISVVSRIINNTKHMQIDVGQLTRQLTETSDPAALSEKHSAKSELECGPHKRQCIGDLLLAVVGCWLAATAVPRPAPTPAAPPLATPWPLSSCCRAPRSCSRFSGGKEEKNTQGVRRTACSLDVVWGNTHHV